jgi:hypothetical protein
MNTAIKQFHEKYHSYYNIAFFLGGFLFDILTLGRIDDPFNLISFIAYFLISGVILLGHLQEWEWELKLPKFLRFIAPYLDEAYHFCQGALLSAFSIFYFKSASGISSFIFILIITTFLILNEIDFFKKLGPLVKSILFHLNFFSFIIAVIPQLIGKMNMLTFFLSVSVFCFLIYLNFKLICKLKTSNVVKLKNLYLKPGLITACFFLFLYLLKVIPPIPLSLQYAGIYHNLEKIEGKYHLYHQNPWYRFWHRGDQRFSARTGDKVYFFASIFAPRGFEDKIYLRFEKEIKGKWKQSDKIPLRITGGREKGFRGFAYKENYTEGKWRAYVETQSGLEIGSISFMITNSNEETLRVWKKHTF